MGSAQGNVLDKAQGGDAIRPGAIGKEQAGLCGGGQGAADRPKGGSPGKRIAAAHRQGAQARDLHGRDGRGNGLGQKGRRVGDHEPGKARGVLRSNAHADGPAPVVHDEGDPFEFERINQQLQVVHVL